jgi:hypothetical protein
MLEGVAHGREHANVCCWDVVKIVTVAMLVSWLAEQITVLGSSTYVRYVVNHVVPQYYSGSCSGRRDVTNAIEYEKCAMDLREWRMRGSRIDNMGGRSWLQVATSSLRRSNYQEVSDPPIAAIGPTVG